MDFQLEFERTDESMHRVGRELHRRMLRKIVVPSFIAAGIFVLLGLLLDKDDVVMITLTTLLAGMFAILLILAILLRKTTVNLSTAWLKKLTSRMHRLKFSDSGFVQENESGTLAVKWEQTEKLLITSRDHVLFLTPALYINVPTNMLAKEQQVFIVGKVKEAGGKVA